MKRQALSLAVFALVMACALPALAQQVHVVDDDGAECPGALTTIQGAVARAAAGDTILVCPGAYFGAVEVKGADKNGLRIIANGRQGKVVLAGDHTMWRAGFLLEDVSGVRLRGFTIKDFGTPRTPGQAGSGESILLRRAHNNIIQNNVMTSSEMMGITMLNSANNLIEDNVVYSNDPMMNGCGIHIEGTESKDNTVRHNFFYDNPLAGIMLSSAGPGNLILENNCSGGRRFGITNISTNGTRIERNRANYNTGFDEMIDILGARPRPGIGIDVRGSTGVTVSDNDAENNGTLDIRWDGAGENTFTNNRGTVQVFRLTVSSGTVAPGGPITVTWTASSRRPVTDWIGLYALGAADTDTNLLGWLYTGGAASGSLTFTAPRQAGRYELRYFLEDGFTQVAWSPTVTVQ